MDFESDSIIHSIFIPAYNQLSNSVQSDGSIYDFNVKSKLNFQYHTAYYVLSSLILNYLTGNQTYEKNAYKTLHYLSKIGYKINRGVNPFIGIAIALSYSFTKSEYLRKFIINYLDQIDFFPSLTQNTKSANNFYALKALALLLRYGITKHKVDFECAKEISYDYFVYWQLEDGFFYDSPFSINYTKGTLHLTYHSTMWMVMVILGWLFKDDFLIKKSILAYNALKTVTSPNGFFSYGRSNNTSFGFSSAILASTIQARITKNRDELSFRDLMFNTIKTHIMEDNHLSIVPNKFEEKRIGFDKYMFVTVYGSWTLALLLISHILNPFITES